MFNGVSDVGEFLRGYPGMAIRPSPSGSHTLKGSFAFTARSTQFGVAGEITDSFELRIEIPAAFPKEVPTVYETGGRIPRNGDFHVNYDGTICLGSPLRLLLKLNGDPTLSGFAGLCLVPYLSAISYKLRTGGELVFGDLPHGADGIIVDYINLFGVDNANQVAEVLKVLGMKKRRANKLPCPCGCGLRLGRCKFNATVRRFRLLTSRSWFRDPRKNLGG